MCIFFLTEKRDILSERHASEVSDKQQAGVGSDRTEVCVAYPRGRWLR